MSETPKRKRRRFQFSLRSLMIVVTVAALICATAVKLRTRLEKQDAEHQRMKRQLDEAGGLRPIIRDSAVVS
jgi:hypothetical protein